MGAGQISDGLWRVGSPDAKPLTQTRAVKATRRDSPTRPTKKNPRVREGGGRGNLYREGFQQNRPKEADHKSARNRGT